jgi:tetratricopeptide (TPR) repeat protein
VALNSTGKTQQAIQQLQQVLERAPFDRDSLWAMYSFYRERGEMEKAQPYLERLRRIEPDNPQL